MNIIANNIVVNSFARGRHFKGEDDQYPPGKTEFSQCNLTEDALIEALKAGIEAERVYPGYRKGVVLVRLNGAGFTTPIVKLVEGDRIAGVYEARRDGEDPRLEVFVVRRGGRQAPAAGADIVLYASSVLAEDSDNDLPPVEGNWEVVSINATADFDSAEPDPMPPGTLMANHFGESGGTDTKMSDSEFVEALRKSRAFWKGRARLAPWWLTQ